MARSKIPKKRSNRAQLVAFTTALLSISIGTVLAEKDKIFASVVSASTYLMILMLKEIINRVCLVCEEIYHIPSRYEKFIDIVHQALKFSSYFIAVSITVGFYLFYVTLTYGNPLKETYQVGWKTNLGSLMFSLLVYDLLKPWTFGPLYQSLNISSLSGLNYGSAMAYSFFHGFLQIILPHKGSEQKGIKEIMSDFESTEDVKFAYDRLLVLIPLSLHCPPSVAQRSNIIELAQSLPEIQVSRAGVNKRSYKSTAYKIKKPDNQLVYVCAEYATPLQTLYEIINHRNKHSEEYNLQKKELVLQFYLTLKDILSKDPGCKDCCDIIFFDDKNENGDFVDVGEVLLNHIAKKTRGNRSKR